jgi:hypothetical protein
MNDFSNRLYVAVNGGSSHVIGETGNYGFWHWDGGRRSVQCHAGTNTLVLKNMDMGVKVDQILLSSDSNFVPTGIRQPTQ